MNPYRIPATRPTEPATLFERRPSLILVMIALGSLPIGLVVSACTPGQREAARTALDVIQTTCLIAHQFLPDVDAMKACDVAEPFFDPARKVLAGARVASAQAVAGARTAGVCPPGDEKCAAAQSVCAPSPASSGGAPN